MKEYRITLSDRFGERFVVTVKAYSSYDAVRRIQLDAGWRIDEVRLSA